MSESVDLASRLAALAQTLRQHVRDWQEPGAIDEIRTRLDEPLRVGIAGRVKAGKSTLLNALVGERLAPTDAGECTRIVTWYQHGDRYRVDAELAAGETRALEFRRDGHLEIDLGDLQPSDVARLVVSWPSKRLAAMTLIDTPGLETIDGEAPAHTMRLFGLDTDRPSEVDAVIYLMRHIHRRDADFLESFLDRSLSTPSPVNALAVLSRADEIGAGRLDSLATARTIADRYTADPRVLALCRGVVPVGGLLAETGPTFRESEASALRELASLDRRTLESMLLSVDRFSSSDVGDVSPELRRSLLARLGLFGVKLCLEAIHADETVTGAELSRLLIRESGIGALVAQLDQHFRGRSRALRNHSALVGLRAAADGLDPHSPDYDDLRAELERIEAGAHELAELRLQHLVLTGTIDLDDGERAEISRLTAFDEPLDRLGLDADADIETASAAAVRRIDHWRAKATHPLTDRLVQEAAEIAARSYEGIAASLTSR